MSVGTVTYHFDSVAEILNEVVVLETERFYGAIVEAVDAEPDPVRAVRMLVEPLFAERPEVREHWRVWSDYWTAVVRRPEVAAEYGITSIPAVYLFSGGEVKSTVIGAKPKQFFEKEFADVLS